MVSKCGAPTDRMSFLRHDARPFSGKLHSHSCSLAASVLATFRHTSAIHFPPVTDLFSSLENLRVTCTNRYWWRRFHTFLPFESILTRWWAKSILAEWALFQCFRLRLRHFVGHLPSLLLMKRRLHSIARSWNWEPFLAAIHNYFWFNWKCNLHKIQNSNY